MDDPDTPIILAACKQIGVDVRLYKKPINHKRWTPHPVPKLRPIFAVRFGSLLDANTYHPGEVAIWMNAASMPVTEMWTHHIRVSTWLLHEVAHAVVGADEELCPAWERDACRTLLGADAYKELRMFGDDEDERIANREYKLTPGWSLRIRPKNAKRL
jgi:hypothetical protein